MFNQSNLFEARFDLAVNDFPSVKVTTGSVLSKFSVEGRNAEGFLLIVVVEDENEGDGGFVRALLQRACVLGVVVCELLFGFGWKEGEEREKMCDEMVLMFLACPLIHSGMD